MDSSDKSSSDDFAKSLKSGEIYGAVCDELNEFELVSYKDVRETPAVATDQKEEAMKVEMRQCRSIFTVRFIFALILAASLMGLGALIALIVAGLSM